MELIKSNWTSQDIKDLENYLDTLSRPGKIKSIYDINLTNKSTPIENRKAKEFSEYYEKIWKDIDFHV